MERCGAPAKKPHLDRLHKPFTCNIVVGRGQFSREEVLQVDEISLKTTKIYIQKLSGPWLHRPPENDRHVERAE
jgi:hypothetical protein